MKYADVWSKRKKSYLLRKIYHNYLQHALLTRSSSNVTFKASKVMPETPFQFSIIDINPTIVKKRKSSSPSYNLFNNYQRSQPMASNTALPIITVPSFCNVKEKLLQMATNKKPTPVFHNSTELSTTPLNPRTSNTIRPNTVTKPKYSQSFSMSNIRPTTSIRSNNQPQINSQLLYIVNTPKSSYQAALNRPPNPTATSPQPPVQQQSLPRPQYQYGHFLAHLRRQSLARVRRKQQQAEGINENVETKITLNLNRNLSSQSFISPSNQSLASLSTETAVVPTISVTATRAGRPISSYRHIQRSVRSFRLNTVQQSPTPEPKDTTDNPLLAFQSSSLLITPRNSIVDDNASSIVKPSYDLHLNDDMLNYCYVSADSGVKYQGQMFPAAF